MSEVEPTLSSASGRQLGAGVLLSYLTLVVGVVSGLFLTPWMLRTVGVADFGIYMLALSLVNFLAIDFGLYNVVSRYMSRYYKLGQASTAARFIALVLTLYSLLDVLLLGAFSALWVSADGIFVSLGVGELSTFRDVFVPIAVYSLLSFPVGWLGGILIAGRQYAALRGIDLLVKVLNLVFTVVALLAVGSVLSLVWAFVASSAIGVLCKVVAVLRHGLLPRRLAPPGRQLATEVLRFALGTAIISVATRLTIAISPTLLAIGAGPEAVAVFSIAMMFEGYLWTLGHAMNSLFMPRLTGYLVDGDRGRAVAEVHRTGRLQLAVSGLAIVGFLLIGPDFLDLWLGYESREIFLVASLLLLPSLLTVPQEICNTWLSAAGKIGYRSLSAGTAGIVSVALSTLLIPVYGAAGAAIGIFTGILFGNIILANGLFRSILGLSLRAYARSVHLRFFVPSALATAAALLWEHVSPLGATWFNLLFEATIVALIYGLLAWRLGMTKADRRAIKSLLRR